MQMTARALRLNDVVLRLISGIFIVALVLGSGWLNLWVFAAVVAVALVLAGWELGRLLVQAGYAASPSVIFSAGFAAALSLYLSAPWNTLCLSVLLLASLAWQLRRWRRRTVGDWAVSFAGGFYLGWTGGHLVLVRLGEQGWSWLLLTLISVWLSDSAAYVFGHLLGRHKLAPHISPGKTWEGYVSGAIAGLSGGAAMGMLTPIGLPLGLVTGGLIGTLSVLGDLIESMIKRLAHAKDSGHLIPGHGGVLDRLDSLLWAGVIAYYARVLL
ncbi:MAG: phosphatidate cytidylyltransferase [Anaerolineae bacterium]|nr:phosphatidate cytidylyltransferase [Thermoflexales bacterium]MDW8292691.1 phosphatidate cytidylyltransferase [Anaerolineae bacterium]